MCLSQAATTWIYRNVGTSVPRTSEKPWKKQLDFFCYGLYSFEVVGFELLPGGRKRRKSRRGVDLLVTRCEVPFNARAQVQKGILV